MSRTYSMNLQGPGLAEVGDMATTSLRAVPTTKRRPIVQFNGKSCMYPDKLNDRTLSLTKIADTPDLEIASWKVLHDHTTLKIQLLKSNNLTNATNFTN